MVKAVIFDMDGVLIDVVKITRSVRKQLLLNHGVDLDVIPDPQGENHRACSSKNLLANIKNHTGVHIDHEKFANSVRVRIHEELQAQNISADPALVAFLQYLTANGIICAVVSSSLRKSIDVKLDILGIRQYFSLIVTASDVKQHKPHPEAYLFAMKELRLQPQDCIIFEDSLTGIEAARAAGGKVIGFTQYNPPENPLTGVIATVKNWSEMSYDVLKA